MGITIDEVGSKVLDLEAVYQVLDRTEPLNVGHIDHDSDIKFHMEPDWATSLDAIDNTDPVSVTMTIDGTERQMTKEAVLQAGANFGLLRPYMKKIPAALTSRLLGYHYGQGMGDEEFNVLTVGDHVAAFTAPTKRPFSNRQLVDNIVLGAQDKLGTDVKILADWKINNSLQRTDVRFILPALDRVIEDGGMSDVPTGEEDTWYHGISFSNSLIGKTQTTMDAYLFRFWCTNGCTTVVDTGTWNRRTNGQADDVYEWARLQVEDVLGGMEFHLDQIQALTKLDASGSAGEVLRQIFDEYKVPVSQRDEIRATLENSTNLSMYSILNAITMAANGQALTDARRDSIMRIGGAIPTDTFDTIKAKVWREGHSADETTPNPYEVRVLN